MWAWLLQRFSGLLLVVTVFVHFWSRVLFPERSLLFAVSDAVMIVLVVFHALNGIRVTLVDLGLSVRLQKALLWGVIALGILTAGAALNLYWRTV